MNNPFDGTFFKFLIGFALILLISFGIIYVAGRYKDSASTQASAYESK